jgi:integrase/recombinase XerD
MIMNFQTAEKLFKFSISLFYRKDKINPVTREVSLYLEVFITGNGNKYRTRLPLDLRWIAEKVDRGNNTLLPRTRKDNDVMDYNMMIISEISKVNEIAKIYRLSNRILTEENLLRELRLAQTSKSLIGYMISRSKELLNKRLISYQTYKNYHTTINTLITYDDKAEFSQISTRWMDGYKAFLKKKGNAHNTVWTRIRDLKAFLRIANDEATIFVDQAAIDYKNMPIDTPTTYLKRDEIQRLINLQNEPLKEIETNVLRAFLFQCFTSLRISDVYKANKKWMMSDTMIIFTMQKNIDRAPKTIKIPIIPIAKAFINETLSKFFSLPTEQEYNRTLKDLARMAEIKKNLHSHVGRHTFGYLFMTAVGDIYALKQIMGHTKITTTERYAHIDDDYEFAQAIKIQEGFKMWANG